MSNYGLLKATGLIQLFVFEITSWYGRAFKRQKNIKTYDSSRPLLLDLGVGLNYKDSWINADFYRLPRFKFWKKYEKRPKIDLELDLRFPLPFANNTIDGIYTGHTLEHLSPWESKALLSEIFRVLKPGCWLRINVPDLEKYVNFYCKKTSHKEFLQFDTGCEAIHSLTQEWGHKSCWDNELLAKTLFKIGFINVEKVKFGSEGTDKRLIKEEKIREWETLVLEAQKPIV
jgi:predicted SAM-dependent methyltransferase